MRDILPELLDFEVVCLDGDRILFTEGFQCDFHRRQHGFAEQSERLI